MNKLYEFLYTITYKIFYEFHKVSLWLWSSDWLLRMTVFEGRPIGLLIKLNYDFDVVVTTWNS